MTSGKVGGSTNEKDKIEIGVAGRANIRTEMPEETNSEESLVKIRTIPKVALEGLDMMNLSNSP